MVALSERESARQCELPRARSGIRLRRGYGATKEPVARRNRAVRSGHRFYSPDVGRWCSRDPIGEEGGLNLYGFVENMGPGFVDVLGMDKYTRDCVDLMMRKLHEETEKMLFALGF